MVLKSLHLQGFKSFPDKTEIQFLGGMTAIVGPNGSGKSNISDAIRWVLGEQSSRSLRGAKMEDVIFGGTTRRGPVGFAEVSLILNNEDGIFRSEFTEIMVTRRYYRSGESEYYINKKHCRLRDIHEMFMDTGLGRDGYSIIGQGRIDEILSLKSEDRREIFEEAAGITKFRYRKEEAERKLAATEENLVRIRDVYAELEGRKAPLERQAAKAKEYLLLRDELRVLEVSLWLRALARVGEDTEKARQDSGACARQLEEACAARDRLYEKSEALAAEMRQAEAGAEGLRARLRETEQRAAEHASRCAVLAANIRNNEDNIARARRESDRQAEQAQSLARQLADRRTRCAGLDAAQEGLLAQQEGCTRAAQELQTEIAGLRASLAQKQGELGRCASAQFDLELKRTAAQSGLSSMASRRDTIAQDIEAAAQRAAAEEAAQEALEQQLAACRDTLAGSQNKLAGVAMKAEGRRRKLGGLEEECRRLEAERTDCQNRIAMLREMQKDYEGFSRSVKLVMGRAERGAMPGVHGPVSTLITVPDEYVLAVETALGAAASNIVVDSPQDGRAAIEYLKRADGGRATFLPLDTIRPNALREQGLERAPGFCGIASALVQCDARYRDVAANLLGRTAVAENMAAALAIAKAHGNRFRIVTKDGQVIQAGGAMTGGSASKTSGVLARAAKLRTLETRAGGLDGQCMAAAQALGQAKRELSALDFDVKAIEAERARALEDQARLAAQLEQHAALVENLRAQHAALALERENLAEARAGYERTAAQAEAALRALEAESSALRDAAADTEALLRAREEAQAEQAREAARLSTAVAENRTEAASERRALADLEALQRDLQENLAGSADAIGRFEDEIARLRDELEEAGRQHADDGGNAEQLRAQIAAAAQQRMRIEGQKAAADKEAQAQGDVILGLEREAARLENRAVQLKNEETQILDKMWEQYELTPTPAAAVAQPLPDPAQAEKDAAALKARMRALGNVNLDAVAEFEELMGRYTFLGGQKEDLERAQAELYKVIDQLTVNMKEIFASEFARLNAYFGETFREIFGGGHAELRLADTSDILNCGIEIRVSPPGKALKTITLLSGGEKAFVAIALYFAILKVRPTPFCVLDEIEAALDDVNVVRFAKYVRRLTGSTQFIVITHRRGTMEEADMLYGVTMQEQGVSKLLMLNLAEAEQRLGIRIK
ncbi:chromosome segregation protein SMC [Intestinibacillus massiliensis]|nr:chromosome segregation protein SMC [Intestinibacillus massiliensis]